MVRPHLRKSETACTLVQKNTAPSHHEGTRIVEAVAGGRLEISCYSKNASMRQAGTIAPRRLKNVFQSVYPPIRSWYEIRLAQGTENAEKMRSKRSEMRKETLSSDFGPCMSPAQWQAAANGGLDQRPFKHCAKTGLKRVPG